jgi:hypothetical protein
LSLERRTLLGERPASSSGRAGRWHLRMRRMMAAAAMIALLGGLGLVVYQILAPIAPTTTPGLVANSGGTDVVASEPTVVVASEGFSGRLEFHTAAMVQANSVVEGAIRENGLTEVAQAEGAEGKRIFHLTCSREAAEQLVADLGSIWENSESVALLVESDRFNDSVAVNSPTLQQATRIIGAESAEASLAVAKLENLAEEIPGRSVVAAASEGVGEAIDVPLALPRPRLVSGSALAGVVPTATEGSVKTTLTIVLSDTRQ